MTGRVLIIISRKINDETQCISQLSPSGRSPFANAAEIYNKDGNKLDLYGRVSAKHVFSKDKSEDGDKTYVRLGFKGETQINDQLTGYGQWEYNVQANHDEAQGTTGTKTRLGFAGLKFANYGSFDYGRNYGVVYDAEAWPTDMTRRRPLYTHSTTSATLRPSRVWWKA